MILTLLVACLAQDEAAVRAAAQRAIPLLEKSAAVYREERNCFSCHHQAVPLLAVGVARKRGFAVDAGNERAQVKYTLESLARARQAYREGRGQGGKTATASYALWTLELGGHEPDETTAAVVEFLLSSDKDHWKPPSNRPPQEASPFTTTAFSLRALQRYGTPAQKERIDARSEKARAWLLAARPADTEDRVFRLWALRYAAGKEVAAAARELADAQRPDGGWAQTAGGESDAYATGSALYALHDSGGMDVADPAYRRGVGWLLGAQEKDGSWRVKTRSKPIQTYFESGFPHGKDQFISVSATAWAVAALAVTMPAR